MTSVDDFSIYSRQYETQTDPLNSASFEELINVVSYNISAFGFNGATYDLTLGGSSNVIIEGSNTMQVYTSSNGVAYYTTTMDGSNRIDDLYYTVTQSNATTYFNTPYNVSFNFADSITLDTITATTSDAFKDVISTTKSFLEIDNTVKITGSLQVDAPILTSGTLSVAGNLMADSNFRCGKSIFGSNINIYRERASNGVDTVGYGFQVNTSNQLELIKTMVFLDSNVVSKKVAVFGYTDIQPTDSDDAEYLVFDELKGLGVGGGSNNSPTFTSGGFLPITGGTMLGDIDMDTQFSLFNAQTISTSNLTASNITCESYVVTGADYAEYMYKTDISQTYVQGQVVGITSQGKLTPTFDDSIRFMIISDNAGIVGGNEWTGLPPSPEDSNAFDAYTTFNNTREIISYCGRVTTETPVNTFTTGDYLVARKSSTGGIELEAAAVASMSLTDYIMSVGQIISITTSGNPLIVVKT